MQNGTYRLNDKVCIYVKFCVNVIQNFVGNKLQVSHTNFMYITCTQSIIQCMASCIWCTQIFYMGCILEKLVYIIGWTSTSTLLEKRND